MNKVVIAAFCLAFTFLSGCAMFTPPKERPVIRDVVGIELFGNQETSVFSLTPERRTVIVVKSNDKIHPLRFCAEPPPDVAEGIASSFKAIAEASLKQGQSDTNLTAAAEISKSFSTSISTLFYRSQGVQLFRDGLFSLCQAYINGVIKPEEFSSKYSELLKTSFILISQEIPVAEIAKTLAASQKAVEAKIAVDSALSQAVTAKQAAEAAAEKAEKALKKVKEAN